MFNFYCDLCGDYQKEAKHKYSLESFTYFTPVEGNMNFEFRFVYIMELVRTNEIYN